MEIIFNQTGEFEAYREACKWCENNGYSRGSMARDMPIGLMNGDWGIAKWYNLSGSERNEIDGTMISQSFRTGPVFINITKVEAV